MKSERKVAPAAYVTLQPNNEGLSGSLQTCTEALGQSGPSAALENRSEVTAEDR